MVASDDETHVELSSEGNLFSDFDRNGSKTNVQHLSVSLIYDKRLPEAGRSREYHRGETHVN